MRGRLDDPFADIDIALDERLGMTPRRELERSQREGEKSRKFPGLDVLAGEIAFRAIRRLKFTGSGVTATKAGDTVTLTITAGSGSGISVVQEGDSTIDGSATTLDFDASDFNVTSSPSGEANISLAYGTSAGTPAEGNHTHAQLHDAVTVADSTSIDLTLTGQQISAAAIFGTTSGTVAEGNHTHTNSLDSLSDVAIAGAGTGEVVVYDGSTWADKSWMVVTIGPFYLPNPAASATASMNLAIPTAAGTFASNAVQARMPRAGRVVGGFLISNAARTTGTMTLAARVGAVVTNITNCVLDGTNTTQDSDLVAHASGISFASGDLLGASIVTSGWAPTTADVTAWLTVSFDPF